MIGLLLRSLLVSTIGAVALLLARRRSASVRHTLVVATLAGSLASVAFAPFLPPLRLPILPAPTRVVTVPTPSSASGPVFSILSGPVDASASAGLETSPIDPLLWGWIAGSFLLAVRLLAAWVRLRYSLRHARTVEGLDAGIAVLESDDFATPFLAWPGRPTLVLPASWREWPVARTDLVIRHEVAHLRRGDGASRLLAGLARAIVWPNPLVWWLVHQEARLAERAVDDLLVTDGALPAEYAEVLLATARDACPGPTLTLSMANRPEVSDRIEMILDPRTPRRSASPFVRRASLVAALALSIPVALGTPEIPQKAAEPVPQLINGVPQQILLRCKVIQTDERGRRPFSSSAKDPSPKAVKVLTEPVIRTLSGTDGTITARCGDLNSGARLLPTLRKDGRIRLDVTGFVYDRGVEMPRNSREPQPPTRETFKAHADVEPYEWVRFWMTDRDGKYRGYQMLVQIVRVPDGE